MLLGMLEPKVEVTLSTRDECSINFAKSSKLECEEKRPQMEPQNSEEFLEEQREIKICLEHRQKEYSEPIHFVSDALPEKVRK